MKQKRTVLISFILIALIVSYSFRTQIFNSTVGPLYRILVINPYQFGVLPTKRTIYNKPGSIQKEPFIDVRHFGRKTVTIRLEVSTSNEDWFDLSNLPQEIILKPETKQDLHIVVTIPQNAKHEQHENLSIIATAKEDPTIKSRLELNVIASENFGE